MIYEDRLRRENLRPVDAIGAILFICHAVDCVQGRSPSPINESKLGILRLDEMYWEEWKNKYAGPIDEVRQAADEG